MKVSLVYMSYTITVPEGDFCIDTEECEQVRRHATYIGDDAGLGTSGTFVTYSCNIFNVGLLPAKEASWFNLEKCKQCRQCTKEK